MNSYQSTIDSQSDSNQKSYDIKTKKVISLKKISRKNKNHKIFKNQSDHNKIQIEDPFPNAKNFPPEVRDYALQILNYIKSNQFDSLIPENYIDWQTDIDIHMREILVGWLIEACTALNFKIQTLHMTVLLVDKYCHQRNVPKRRYQVLGGACIYIAAKYLQITTPRLQRLIETSQGAFDSNELLVMQSQVLIILKFNIYQKSSLTFYQIKCEEYSLSKSVVGLGYFLLEMSLIQYQLCRTLPICLSLAILYTAMKLKKKKTQKLKVFVSQNMLDEQMFFTYLGYAEQLFSIRYLSKYSLIRKRYSTLFDNFGELL